MPINWALMGIGFGVSALGNLLGSRPKTPSWTGFDTSAGINFNPTIDFGRAFQTQKDFMGAMPEYVKTARNLEKESRQAQARSFAGVAEGFMGRSTLQAQNIAGGAGFRSSGNIANVQRKQAYSQALDKAATTFDSSPFYQAQLEAPFRFGALALESQGQGLQAQTAWSGQKLQKATQLGQWQFDKDKINAMGRWEAAQMRYGQQASNRQMWGDTFRFGGGLLMGNAFESNSSSTSQDTNPSTSSTAPMSGPRGGWQGSASPISFDPYGRASFNTDWQIPQPGFRPKQGYSWWGGPG